MMSSYTKPTLSASRKRGKSLIKSSESVIVKEYSNCTQCDYWYGYNDGSPQLISFNPPTSHSIASYFSIQFLLHSFLKLFLPVDYPSSVSGDYLLFQVYDTIQAVSSYLRGLLCTQALLKGFGVGDSTATISSATLNWLLRDGVGLVTGLGFGYYGSNRFGYEIKQWRLTADIANDIGLTLELISPHYPQYFLVLVSIATILKTICGVAAGATKAALMQHFALANNVADLSTKEYIQETFVTIIGLIAGLICTKLIDNNTNLIWLIFIILTILHIIANILAMRSLILKTLNYQRFQLIFTHYINNIATNSSKNAVLSPDSVSQLESIYYWPANSIKKLKLGCALAEFQLNSNISNAFAAQSLYKNANYLISSDSRCIRVCYSIHCKPRDKLQSLFHAALIQINSNLNLIEIAERVSKEFGRFERGLKERGWRMNEIEIAQGPFKYEIEKTH